MKTWYKHIKLPTDAELSKELGLADGSISRNSRERQSSRDKALIMKLGMLKKLSMNPEVVENLTKQIESDQVYIYTIRTKRKLLMFLGLLHKAEIDAIKGV